MANVLPFAARVAVIAHLVQGTSIRATATLCGVDKDAVMHLGVIVGLACLVLHDRLMTGVRSALLEVDEVWAYVGRHDRRRLAKDPPEFGDHYTMFAIDPVSKLVPSFLTGRRNPDTALSFACDLRNRVLGKPQVSVDGWPHWYEAFRKAFGWSGIDLGVIIKEYENDSTPKDPARKYSPGRVKSVEKRRALGGPSMDAVSTALAERLNLTTRMHMRRLTRLTNAYSKKAENLRAAVGLHFAWYNLVRVHETIKTTPAVAAGVVDAPWSLPELVAAALAIAEETPETPAPAPAPAPVGPETPWPPFAKWGTWRAPVQLPLPGVDAANDNATTEADENARWASDAEMDGPATQRDPIPYGEGAAL